MPRLIHALLLTSSLALAPGCVDATHEAQVEALGPETPGGPSPLHRPGQPCGVCHGELGPADSEFLISGTVYELRSDDAPAPGALVELQDSTGSIVGVRTNEAGNFWLLPTQWAPVFPLQTRVTYRGIRKQMSQAINRETSCGACHLPMKPANDTPGRIYITTSRSRLEEASQ